LQESAKSELRQDLEHLFAQFNEATDGTTSLKGEYLEIVATKSTEQPKESVGRY
jgi:hypothetical protein